jgi:hypothetical protein
MPKQKTDDLIQLIKSLSRAEKRHFRLFVRRNQASDDILFLKLFDFLDKHKSYDEALVLKKMPDIKKRQLSNLKAHLYKQLLISLRLLSANHNDDIRLREMIDYARVLYNKGLYRQSLDMLSKAKEKAYEGKFFTLALEIVEFEKHIESQYITRSLQGRSSALARESLELNESIYHSNLFSSLSLQLYGRYLNAGYARNEADYLSMQQFFEQHMPQVAYERLDFLGRVHYCQAHVWYYHTTQDFPFCYRHAQRWVSLFLDNPVYQELYAPLYLKGLHNLLNALYNTLQHDRFLETLNLLTRFPRQFDMKAIKNIEGLYYLYYYIHSVKRHFMEGTFSEGAKLAPQLMEIIEEDKYNWDERRIMIFYYRIACLYFGSGDNESAIDYLNILINQKNPDYREDIQCFARILNLIAHYELGNAQLVEYQVKSVYRFLSKMQDLQSVQLEIFRFLRKIPRISEENIHDEFIALKERLLELEKDPFQRRPFLYLDIISWLESKIEGCPIQETIRSKFLERQASTA